MGRFLKLTLILFVAACQHPDAAAAIAVHRVFDKVMVMLVQQYEKEGLKAVDMATSRDEAVLLVEAVDLRWAPVWTAYTALQTQYNEMAEELESDNEVDSAATLNAWCTLKHELERLGSVPQVLRLVNYECE